MAADARPMALVTGASFGIGEAFARALAARGYDLFLVARSAEKLALLARELGQAHGVEAEWLALDLTAPGAAQRLYDATKKLARPIDLLINNAGFGTYGEFARLPLERELEMVDLNIKALVTLARLYLPDMLARRAGTIINVASTAGFQGVPYMTTYAATKAFVLNFSEALWAETEGSGVHVLALCPGPTRSQFQRVAGIPERMQRVRMETSEQVVENCLRALHPRRSHVISGWRNRWMIWSERLAPRSFVVHVAAGMLRPR